MGRIISRTVVRNLLALVFISAQPVFGALYQVIDLGTLGGNTSQALGINNAGQIVGFAYLTNDSVSHATLWNSSQSPALDLGALAGGNNSAAFGINDSGQIAGSSALSNGTHAISWTNSTSPGLDLGTLGGSISAASGINVAGQMVGVSYTTNNFVSVGAYWNSTSNAAMKLALLSGGINSAANAINQAGRIAGWSEKSGGVQHAVLWSNSSSPAIDLWVGQNFSSDALAINDDGQIVGWGYNSNSVQHAFLWNNGTNNPPVDLGTLGGVNSQANGINQSGQIVGWANIGGGASHAALWTNSLPIDLNGLIATNTGWLLESASAINDSSEIVGYGIINGHTHAFAMLPLPSGDLRITLVGTNVRLTFSTNPMEFYDVQRTDNLASNSWSTVASNIAGNGSVITNIDVGAATAPKRFYRVGAHF